MKRTSFLAELELNYIYALHAKNFQIGAGTNFFTTIIEYIGAFYDKSDVVADVKAYLKLFNSEQDSEQMKERLLDTVQNYEQMEADEQKEPGRAKMTTQPVSLRVIRWRFVFQKVMRLLGINTPISDEEKIDLVNSMYSNFLQAMEYHQDASSNSGVGANHQ